MGGKAGKLKYVTPTFSGFTGYASYTAAETLDISSVTASVASRNTSHDGSTMGVAYEGELSGVALSADVTHFRNNGTSNVTHGGLNVGMAGFTVGGGYSDFNDDTSVNTGAATSSMVTNDGNAWELGVGYETGPYSLAVGYMNADSKGTAAAVQKNEDTRWNVGVAYDLGAGVALTADYFHNNANPEDTVATPTTVANGKETTVSGVLAGIEVGF
jgi:outer membrane protein OmpU